jgi:hypothetical protein
MRPPEGPKEMEDPMQTWRSLRALSIALAVSLFWLGAVTPAARAAVVSTEAALGVSAAGDGHRAEVEAFLARADVRSQLETLGVNPDAAKNRVALLTDQEASQLSAQIDELPAGGVGWLGVIGIIALVLLTLIFLDYFGVTDIFPWVHARR